MTAIFDQGPLAVLFALVIIHAVADYPLQGAYMAQQKTRHQADSSSEWFVALSAHCLIHAGGVWLITGNIYMGLIELVLHSLIDTGKSQNRYGLLVDQCLHVLCKVGYVIFWMIAGC